MELMLLNIDSEIKLYVVIGICFVFGFVVIFKVMGIFQRSKNSVGLSIEESDHENDYFEILGIDPTRNYSEIKHAYHEKIKQYHPDKTVDLAKDFYDLAVRETKKINKAYEYLGKKYH